MAKDIQRLMLISRYNCRYASGSIFSLISMHKKQEINGSADIVLHDDFEVVSIDSYKIDIFPINHTSKHRGHLMVTSHYT